jgi:uncharacterized membrane protein YkvA (DUF1232 family)
MRRPLEAGAAVHHIYRMKNGQDGMDDALIGEILEPGSGEEQNRREQRVRKQFWSTVRKAARKVPFMEDVVAGYFCALDPKTPARVRGILLAALAYFVLPLDFIPDFLLGVGFTDDVAVLMAALGAVRSNITDAHRLAARRALADHRNDEAETDKPVIDV